MPSRKRYWLDEASGSRAQIENGWLLPEEGRDFTFPLDQSEERSNRGGPSAHRNQRTAGKEDFEEPERRIKGRTTACTGRPGQVPETDSYPARIAAFAKISIYFINPSKKP